MARVPPLTGPETQRTDSIEGAGEMGRLFPSFRTAALRRFGAARREGVQLGVETEAH
jgi:hypothetical protein